MANPLNAGRLVNWHPGERHWREFTPAQVYAHDWPAAINHPATVRVCEHAELIEIEGRGWLLVTESEAGDGSRDQHSARHG